jgi:hypothetical protein
MRRCEGRGAPGRSVHAPRRRPDLLRTDDVKRLIPFAKKVLGRLGYRVARRKINLFRRGRRQVVTGLVVNDLPGWPRHLRRLLRAAVDRQARGENPTWGGVPLSDDRLRGLIAFLNLTRPAEAANLRARLPSLFAQRRVRHRRRDRAPLETDVLPLVLLAATATPTRRSAPSLAAPRRRHRGTPAAAHC